MYGQGTFTRANRFKRLNTKEEIGRDNKAYTSVSIDRVTREKVLISLRFVGVTEFAMCFLNSKNVDIILFHKILERMFDSVIQSFNIEGSESDICIFGYFNYWLVKSGGEQMGGKRWRWIRRSGPECSLGLGGENKIGRRTIVWTTPLGRKQGVRQEWERPSPTLLIVRFPTTERSATYASVS